MISILLFRRSKQPSTSRADPLDSEIFQLLQNYPNPFNNITTIRYFLPRAGKVTLVIYDTTGRIVDRLITDAEQKAGGHSIQWQNPGLASGLYFYQIRSGSFEAVRKCILIK